MSAQAAPNTFTLLPTFSLAKREFTRFYRQRSRVIGSLGTPLFFWILLGSGLQTAFPGVATSTKQSFLQYFFPGSILLTILFTSIFSNISVIEDRHEGFLQSVMVAPVSRVALVGGKVWGGTVIALIQGILFLFLAPLAGIPLTVGVFFTCVLSMLVISLTLTALGFLFAWKLDSVQGFHSIMNLVLVPMWLLSGAFFPLSRAPLWLKPIMIVNPLTYGFLMLQKSLYWDWNISIPMPFWGCFAITLGFGVAFYLYSMKIVNERKEIHS